MRRCISTRYNDKEWPALAYLAHELDCDPKEAQKYAVIVAAKELLRQRQEDEAAKKAVLENPEVGDSMPIPVPE